MTIEQRIGYRIRKVREGKNVTLSRLAEMSNLSKSLLSKIENGKVSSPISTLSLIASVLKVKLSYFIDEDEGSDEQKCVLVKKGERKRFDKGTDRFGFYYDSLAYKKKDKLMDAYILLVDTKRRRPVLFNHPGEEMLFVLEGRMEFTYGEHKYQMEQGDCVYFEADVPHGGRNIGDQPLRVLMVICNA